MLNQSNVLLLLALLLAIANGQGPQVITVTNGETEGEWGPLESCPTGARVNTYQTQNEANIPVTDDTAVNSIMLFCSDTNLTTITSTVGYTGNWQNIQSCPFGGYMNAFQLKVSPNGNVTDNSAVNNIRFRCSVNDWELNGIGNNRGYWGDWSETCEGGICGIETRVKPQGSLLVDNTALNDVRFTCCNPADF